MINSVVKVFRGIAKLRGATDNTLIGNIGDQLKVTFLDGVTRLFEETQTATTPGTPDQVLISYTVPGGKSLYLSRVTVSCRQAGRFDIYEDANIIGSGRTGPSEMNSFFKFDPTRVVPAGASVEIKFNALNTSASASDIESYLQGSLT